MKNKPLLVFIGLIVVVGGLLYLSRSLGKTLAYWPGTTVECLQNGHQSALLHIHPHLSITVDGTPEAIPANVGVTATCMAEIHTHDGTGELHIESASAGRTLTLADFFAVRGQSLERPGYTYTVAIDGDIVTDVATRPLGDKEHVIVAYTSDR